VSSDLEVAPAANRLIPWRVHRHASRFLHSPVAMTATVALTYTGVSVFVFGRAHIDRPTFMAFCAALAFALSAQQPSRRLLALLADWVPLALVLVAYDFARGAGYRLGIGTSYTLSPRMDRWLTGTLPTVWLQRHLYATSVYHWWDIFPTLAYTSYYVVTLLILAVLWSRSRHRFRVYSRRFLMVTVLSLVMFVLHPTAPPWLDSARGVIPHITRTTTFGLNVVHLPIAERAFYASATSVNEVAAFPSLHAACSVLPLMMFWRRSRPAVPVLLVRYPLAMDFCLILMGEHWLSDIVAAWLLTALVTLGMPVAERQIARFRAARRSRPERLLAGGAVGELPYHVELPDVAGVLREQVKEDPDQRRVVIGRVEARAGRREIGQVSASHDLA
jgi:hypothetical protein